MFEIQCSGWNRLFTLGWVISPNAQYDSGVWAGASRAALAVRFFPSLVAFCLDEGVWVVCFVGLPVSGSRCYDSWQLSGWDVSLCLSESWHTRAKELCSRPALKLQQNSGSGAENTHESSVVWKRAHHHSKLNHQHQFSALFGNQRKPLQAWSSLPYMKP